LVGSNTDQRLSLKSGEQRVIRWRLAPLERPDAAGAATYAVGVDVTDEKDLERRTRTAERLAALGTLAAGLAHEVRNPLNSASLQLQVLNRRLQKHPEALEQCSPIVDVVRSEIQRLDHLVSDFLAFARPRPLDREPHDIHGLLLKVQTLIEPEATEANVVLKLQLGCSVATAWIEPARLEQVFLNLTRNALEAMQGGGTLTLRTETAALEGGEPALAISVEDTGPGFPEDAPVFDAFFTTKHHGTGLGLAIAHRIVGDHGGTIHERSRPGHTVFTIRLPAGS
jgi:signal transduction histidine kinase